MKSKIIVSHSSDALEMLLDDFLKTISDNQIISTKFSSHSAGVGHNQFVVLIIYKL